jgi:hypothetical protein
MNVMKTFYFALYISFILLLSACGGGKSKDNVSVSGKFVFSKGEMLYLYEVLVFDKALIDSVRLEESGEFSFKFHSEDEVILWLGTSSENYVTLICSPDDKAELTGDVRSLPATYAVSGSPASEQILQLHKFTMNNYAVLDSLSLIWEKRKYDNDRMLLRDTLDSLAFSIYDSQKAFVIAFIDKNMHSLASVMALYQVFGRMPLLDEFEYIELYEKTVQKLKEHHPGNQHVNELSARVEKNKLLLKEKQEVMKRLEPGNPVPQLSLSDRNGAPVSVSDYKGFTILINFWSATNPVCRKLNLQLVQLHKLHSARGFLLFNVSFDNNQDVWKAAINHDKLPGIHVNDQRDWNSPVVQMFNIPELPYSVLVDKDGNIVGNGLSYDEINSKLYELLPFRRVEAAEE